MLELEPLPAEGQSARRTAATAKLAFVESVSAATASFSKSVVVVACGLACPS